MRFYVMSGMIERFEGYIMFKQDLYDYIFKDIVLVQSADILDVGCLNGKSLTYLKEKYRLIGKLIGIDKNGKNFETKELQISKEIELIEMNASEALQFPDESFDLIFHKDTLIILNYSPE